MGCVRLYDFGKSHFAFKNDVSYALRGLMYYDYGVFVEPFWADIHGFVHYFQIFYDEVTF